MYVLPCVWHALPASCLLHTDHSNRVNKAIHLLCIWPIVWTGMALMTFFSLGKLPPGVLDHLPLRDDAWNLHAGTLVVVVYVVVYCGKKCRTLRGLRRNVSAKLQVQGLKYNIFVD